MSERPPIRVFVYGSLLSGERHHDVLGPARFVTSATTEPRFTLYDLGPYPGMTAGGSDVVAGEVYEVDGDTLARLDAFEDHPRLYVRTRITLGDGSLGEAYLADPRDVDGRRRIESGSWRDRQAR